MQSTCCGANNCSCASLADNGQIRWHCKQIHDAANGCEGLIIPFASVEDLDTGEILHKEHKRFHVGAIDETADWVIEQVLAGRNVWLPWAVFNTSTPEHSRGSGEHAIAILALVADRDADTGKFGRNILEPTYRIVSSRKPKENFNDIYIFEKPLDFRQAQMIGNGLRAAMNADSGTGNPVTLSRIAGTGNFPTNNKIKRGRPRCPQPVRLGEGTNQRYTEQEVIEAIEAATDRPIESFDLVAKAKAPSGQRNNTQVNQDTARARKLFESLPESLQGMIQFNDTADRSVHCFNVECQLFEMGLSDDDVAAVLSLYPRGAAAKFIGEGRLYPEVQRSRTKWQQHQDQTQHDHGSPGIGHNANAIIKYITEVDMAVAFVEEYRHRIKYDHDLKLFYYWDGDVWQVDREAYVFRLIQDFCRLHEGTRSKRKFSSRNGLANVEVLVQRQREIAMSQETWDPDPFILGCRKGYVNLETGEIQPPQPSKLVTKLTNTTPQRGRPELWLDLLHYWTGGDTQLIRFLQQMCGYLLTGDTSEQKVFFFRGPSATGKGTFAYVLSEILRDYAVTGDDQMLAYSGHRNIDEALASARGARIFLFDELPHRFKLNDALIKRLSGESRVTARALYGRRFDYLPTYKVLLLSNYDPNIPPDNDALKRRLIVIPFDRKAKEIDPTLRAQLRAEFPQILSWMIAGAADWHRNGFQIPKSVYQSADEYFEEQDIVQQFISECCEVGPELKDTSANLFDAWRLWCKAQGHDPGSTKSLGTELRTRGYESCVIRSGNNKKRGRSGLRVGNAEQVSGQGNR